MSKGQDGKPLIILYILICLSGIGYYYLTIKSGNLALWLYDKDVISTGSILPKLINYIKDVYLLLFMIACFIKQNEVTQMPAKWFVAFCAVLIGAALDIVSGQSLMCVVAGIRAYGYAFIVYAYCEEAVLTKEFYHRFYLVTYTMLILQTGAVLLQYVSAGGGFSLGSGGYRMMGLFTNAGTLGMFAVGVSVTISVLYIKYDFINVAAYLFASVMVIFTAVASGTRSAALYSLLFLLFGFFSRVRLSSRAKMLMIPLTAIIIGLYAIKILVAYVNRGELMVSGMGRIRAWTDLLEMDLRTILIGDGLGVGTNTAISLGITSIDMDSTFTIVIIQYGVWGFLLFIYALIKFSARIICIEDDNVWYRIWYVACIWISLFSGDLFEQYVMILPMIMAYFCMTSENEWIADENYFGGITIEYFDICK